MKLMLEVLFLFIISPSICKYLVHVVLTPFPCNDLLLFKMEPNFCQFIYTINSRTQFYNSDSFSF